MRLSLRRVAMAVCCAGATLALVLVCQRVLLCQRAGGWGRMVPEHEGVSVRDWRRVEYRYSKATPLVFVGGVPRSGTTLMRAMLDAHPLIRCGEETRVIPRLLAMRQAWARSSREKQRLDEAGVTDHVLDSAISSFILEVIARHGEPAPVLCNKDPFTLKSALYLSRIFPRSKFLLMFRDGRAAVHSMITRKVTIAGFDLSSYRDCLSKWSRAMEAMLLQCQQVGPLRCMAVRYETLVLQPRQTLRSILRFLDVAWDEAVLHHEDAIGQPGGVSLSRVERSTDQVIKPVNLEALSRWVGHIPEDVLADMADIAPMLSRLGYDPHANPPRYGEAEPAVLNNTERVLKGDYKTPSKLKGQLPVLLNVSDTERRTHSQTRRWTQRPCAARAVPKQRGVQHLDLQWTASDASCIGFPCPTSREECPPVCGSHFLYFMLCPCLLSQPPPAVFSTFPSPLLVAALQCPLLSSHPVSDCSECLSHTKWTSGQPVLLDSQSGLSPCLGAGGGWTSSGSRAGARLCVWTLEKLHITSGVLWNDTPRFSE